MLAIASVDANAAGFQLGENSTVALGRAFAGAGVVGDDLSAIANNPAGMSLFNGTMAGQAGITLIDVNAEYNGEVTTPLGVTTTESINPSTLSAVPHTYVVGKVNDKVNIGLGITTPFGLETDYDDTNWAGNFMGVRSFVMTVDINPTVSYKINDKWSVGAGLSAQYLEATLTSKVSGFPGAPGFVKVNGDSWAYGYNLGVMYEPKKDTRVGLSFRSKMEHDVEGTTLSSTYGSYSGTEANMVLPETLMLSGFHKLNDKVGLSVVGRWTNWSRFKELTVTNSNIPALDSTTDENWRDTWSFGVGADYYYNESFTFRAGLGYDKNPITSSEFRTPRIPDADRIQLGIGASWKYNESVTFDVGYMHLFMKESDSTHAASGGSIDGTFEPYTNLLSASVQVKF